MSRERFAELGSGLEVLKEICKNYVEIAVEDKELFRCAATLYKQAVGQLNILPKKLRTTFRPQDEAALKSTMLILHLNKAYVDLKIQNYEEAKKSAECALALDGNSLKARFRLGVACYHLHNKKAAYDAFMAVAKVEPTNEGLKPYADFIHNYTQEVKLRTQTGQSLYKDFWKKYAIDEQNEARQKELQDKLDRRAKKVQDVPEACFNFGFDPLLMTAPECPFDTKEDEGDAPASPPHSDS